MNPELARAIGRHLRRTGAILSALSVAVLVALRFAAPRGPPVETLGEGILLASAAMVLTFFAALGLALVVAGVAFGLDERAREGRAAGPVTEEE